MIGSGQFQFDAVDSIDHQMYWLLLAQTKIHTPTNNNKT